MTVFFSSSLKTRNPPVSIIAVSNRAASRILSYFPSTIIASLIFQIIDTKNNNFLDESSIENNKRKVKNGDKKDINKNEEDEDSNNNKLSFKEGTSGFQSEKSGNIIQNSNDDNSEFDDQDD